MSTFKPRLQFVPPDLASGTMQFYDGTFPALTADTYTIAVEQTLTASGTPTYSASQTVVVQSPEFVIDPNIVQMVYPPEGTSGIYGSQLPFIVLTDPTLPWERSLTPGGTPPSNTTPTPWLALLIFQAGEIDVDPDSNNPVTTMTAGELATTTTTTLGPALALPEDVQDTQVQAITITGKAFEAIVPSTTDLPYLAHCRAINNGGESAAMMSVLIANRLAVTNETPLGSPIQRYYAHLVSLEGFAAYLGPNGQSLPAQPDSDELVNVQMASLFNWTFVSIPAEEAVPFQQIMSGLVASQDPTSMLQLPLPSTPLPQPAQGRIEDGYVALTFESGSGEETFAWYRGPFTAAPAQPLPAGMVPSTAEAFMIYLAAQGLFDLSYAAAWNIGRQLALADANFAQLISGFQLQTMNTLQLMAGRDGQPLFDGVDDPHGLARRKAARKEFARKMAGGLGTSWTEALRAARDGARPPRRNERWMRGRRRRSHPRDLLRRPGVAAAIAADSDSLLGSIAEWIARLLELENVPFSHLVPDPRMLPAESVRFFYVDVGWLFALAAGALSLGLQNFPSGEITTAMVPFIAEKVAAHFGPMATAGASLPTFTGMLIRSQVVTDWPTLVVTASAGGTPIPIVRDDTLSSSVRLVAFAGVPDTVSLSQPYHAMEFGAEDGTIIPHAVTASGGLSIGQPIPGASPVPLQFRGPVLDVSGLAAALMTATGATAFGAGDFAIQLVAPPEEQLFVAEG